MSGRSKLTIDQLTDELIELLKKDLSGEIYNRKLIRSFMSRVFNISSKRYQKKNKQLNNKSRKAKPVIRLDEYGNHMSYHKSANKAQTDLAKEGIKVYASAISMVCHGKRTMAGNWYWKFA